MPASLNRRCHVNGRLPAKLNTNTVGLHKIQNFKHVFRGEGFKKEHVAGVIICGHCFGVGIDHDGRAAFFPNGSYSLNTTIVKLDSLTNPIGAAAQNHHGIFLAQRSFGLSVIGGIIVRSVRLKLTGASVDGPKTRSNLMTVPGLPDLQFVDPEQAGQAFIRKAHFFKPKHLFRIVENFSGNGFFGQDQCANLFQKPWSDGGQFVNFLNALIIAEGLGNMEEPLRMRSFNLLLGIFNFIKTSRSFFQGGHRFLETLFEGPPDSHDLPHTLHLSGKRIFHSGEFFKIKTGNFRDDIINTGFKTAGGGFGDVIQKLVQLITDGQFSRDFGDGKTRGFAGESRTAGDPRVHFDDNSLPGFRIHRELNIGAAGGDSNGINDFTGFVAHLLILAIGQRHGGSNGDAIARMNSHGIKILDGTNDDESSAVIPHDLQLKLFPT